jgi:hypothetical protein
MEIEVKFMNQEIVVKNTMQEISDQKETLSQIIEKNS